MKRVRIKNNWGNYIYYIDGKEINPEDIKIIYDKIGNEYEVIHKTETIYYNDMGHTYPATRVILCVDYPLGKFILRENSEFYIK